MFNLLRMDLYRIVKSRSMYVCFGIVQVFAVMSVMLLWLLGKGHEFAVMLGMSDYGGQQSLSGMLNGLDLISVFRDTALDGGAYSLMLGIWVMMFTCMDYQNGFIKNILSVHVNRWEYVISRILSAGIVNFFWLVLHYGFLALLNLLFGNLVPHAAAGDVLFYLGWAWLLTTAFAALIVFICVLTRSAAAGTLAAVCFSSGAVVAPLYGILQMFHKGGWLKHTIYFVLREGPGQFDGMQDLTVYVTGAVFVLAYGLLAGIVVKRQNI